MTQCEKCFYYPKCYECPFDESGCKDYKDRARFFEAPCKMGGTIYMIVTKRARVYTPEHSFVKTSYLTEHNFFRVIRDFGKTVFLTRAEAEKALAEMKKSPK